MRNFTNNIDLCFWLFQMEFLITRTPCPGSQFLFTSLNPKQTTHQMWCKRNSSNPPVLCKFPTKEPKLWPKTITFSSSSNNKKQELISTTAVTQVQVPESNGYNVKFKTLGGCKLGISRYSNFGYDAEGGIGTGSGTKVSDSELMMKFQSHLTLKHFRNWV